MSAQTQEQTLHKNLRAIAATHVELAERLCLPVRDDQICIGEDGETLYQYGRIPRKLNLSSEELPQPSTLAANRSDMVIAGVGLGEAVEQTLRLSVATVRAWERDPLLLRLALSVHDWSEAILSGRLVLYLGADCVKIPHSARQGLWCHPVLEGIYGVEMPLLRKGVKAKRALVCAGELFVRDIAQSLEEMDYSVYTWDIEGVALDELSHTVHTFEPEVVFSVNFSNGLSEACADFGIPLAIWEIDPSSQFLPQSEVSQTHTSVFTYRKSRVQDFQKAGFPNTQYLPLAANTDRRKPVELSPTNKAHYGNPVSFVGASMVQTALKFQETFQAQVRRCYPNAAPEAPQNLLEEIIQCQRQDFMSWQIPALLEERAPHFRSKCRDLGLDDPAILLGEIAAAEKRLNTVARLAEFDIQVWGDIGWKKIESFGVTHRGYAGHFKELNAIYSSSLINIDIGRLYQNDIVPMRIFDILSCGGFVLAEYTPALDELFELDQELVCWKDHSELKALTQHFLRNPSEARSIAERGRKRVCQDHQIKDRVKGMLESLKRRAAA